MSHKKVLFTIIGSLVILVGSIGLMQLFGSYKEVPIEKKEIKAFKKVKTQKVSYENITSSIEFYGRVKNNQRLDIIAEVSGKIRSGSIRLQEGERFRKGDILFEIDDPQATFQLHAQKSNLIRDIAMILPDFKIDFTDSYQKWYDYLKFLKVENELQPLPKGSSPKEKIFLATKGVFSTYYTIKSLEENFKKRTVVATFDGSIVEMSLYPGSFVNPGNKVTKVIKKNNLELKVPITINDLKWVRVGKKIKISSPNTSSSLWVGVIKRIGDVFNPNTQSLDMFISIFPNKNKIYEGMYLKASVEEIEIKNAMRIPRESLINADQIYILEDSILKVKNINIKQITNNFLIFDGIEKETEIVTESVVNPDVQVKVISLEQARENNKNIKNKNEPIK